VGVLPDAEPAEIPGSFVDVFLAEVVEEFVGGFVAYFDLGEFSFVVAGDDQEDVLLGLG
jgi:hypothetical protein